MAQALNLQRRPPVTLPIPMPRKWSAADLVGTAFVLRIEIFNDNRMGGQPIDCFRVVEVPPTFNLRKLHDLIQIIFAWRDCHCHTFSTLDGRTYVPWHAVDEFREGCIEEAEAKLICDESRKKLFAALANVNDEIMYEYDLGDGHEHTITLVNVVYCSDNFVCPRLVEAAGFRPAEDGVFREPVRSLDSVNIELARVQW